MATVADALRQHAPAYLDRYGSDVCLGHRKVLSYITRCRTGQLGSIVYQCDGCGLRHWVGRSCGNRHCPNCQKQKTQLWLSKQTDKLLPVGHFVVTFTVPSELRWLLRANQKDGYNAIFDAGSKTIRLLLANKRYLGSEKVGFFAALHTWGRDPMVYHPHVHFIVPGGGLSPDGKRWLSTPENFLFPHARAIALYKKCFADELRKNGLYKRVSPSAWQGNWVVDIRPVGDGKSVLKYLAPYIYRVAISDNRIEAVDDNNVTYRYTPSGSKRSLERSVPGQRFVQGFVQHILPSGFQKVRYYGWASPNCKMKRENVRWLVWLYRGWTYWLGSLLQSPAAIAKPVPRCSRCASTLTLIAIILQNDHLRLGNPARSRAPPQVLSRAQP